MATVERDTVGTAAGADSPDSADGLELFADERDIGQASGPGLGRVLLTLLGAGVLVAVIVIVLAAALSAGQPTATPNPNAGAGEICGGETSCNDLTLEQIQQLVALELPAGSEIVTSNYESSDSSILVEARVALPDGSANPFDGSPYFEVDPAKIATTFPAGIEPIAYYAATGELGALNADAILGTDSDNRQVVAVHLTRNL